MCLAGVITRCTLQGIQPVETDMLLTYVLLSAIIIAGGRQVCHRQWEESKIILILLAQPLEYMKGKVVVGG